MYRPSPWLFYTSNMPYTCKRIIKFNICVYFFGPIIRCWIISHYWLLHNWLKVRISAVCVSCLVLVLCLTYIVHVRIIVLTQLLLIRVFYISAELKDQLMFTQKQAEEGKIKEQKYNALKGKVRYLFWWLRQIYCKLKSITATPPTNTPLYALEFNKGR